jgi:hypothetical protein
MKKIKKFLAITAIILFNCGGNKTEGNKSTPILYDDWYFTEAKAYFIKLGIHLSDKKIREYRSTLFIETIPPECDILIDTIFIGKSNINKLFLKPGKTKLVFKKGDLKKEEIIEVKEGDNYSKLFSW